MKIITIPVREDNYAYLLIDEPSNKAAAVDPYDVAKVQRAADQHGASIVAAITTHHHDDHSGGNEKFAKAFPQAVIYGGSDRVPAMTKLVRDKDVFKVGDNISVSCMETPCHTQDSICFHATDTAAPSSPGGVFTGDTLFIAGCGKFFEGTGTDMHAALTYLGTLPDDTIVYNGHEYTKGNVAFAASVEPDNDAVKKLQNTVRTTNITTGISTIGDEKSWNPFMRLHIRALVQTTGAGAATPGDVMDSLRTMKNRFRG